MHYNEKRTKKGQFQKKLAFSERKKAFKVTELEKELVLSHRLATNNTVTGNKLVIKDSQSKKEKCYACGKIDKEHYCLIHWSCLEEFMQPIQENKFIRSKDWRMINNTNYDLSISVRNSGVDENIVLVNIND